MLITEIHCKATTPIFIVGADTKKPEMRAASIKGVMRYIWRAVQCAPNTKSLREKEGKLFGNADGDNTTVSPLRLQVVEEKVIVGRENMVPHRDLTEEYDGRGRSFSGQAFKEGSTFIVRVITNAEVSKKQHDKYVSLFVLTTILNGFGRRTRKGMGTVVVTKVIENAQDMKCRIEKPPVSINTPQDLLPLLNAVSVMGTKYDADDNEVWPILEKEPSDPYPYIERIEIWKPKSAGIRPIHITEQIGLATHDLKKKNPHSKFAGTATPRFASSLLMSSMGNENPTTIVTRLMCTMDYTEEERNEFLNDLYWRVAR